LNFSFWKGFHRADDRRHENPESKNGRRIQPTMDMRRTMPGPMETTARAMD
jgi:hypothetical protein